MSKPHTHSPDASPTAEPGQSGLGSRPPLSKTNSPSQSSSIILTPSGHTLAIHTRVQGEEEVPHATKRTMADHLRKYESLFTLTPQRMRIIVDAFEEVLEQGLKEYGQVVPMIPTFVFGRPTGQEQGNYIALDLGGTNLRVCLVTLQGSGKFQLTQSKYRLTEEQKAEEGEKLFDFCAECIKEFVDAQKSEGFIAEGQELALGFTFSYPCDQHAIDQGLLLRWTKGFSAPSVENHDVGELFRKALAKYPDMPVKFTSLINDTTGTLIASAYVDTRTRIGCIFGTGCNAAYIEKVGNITKLKTRQKEWESVDKDAEIAINCEWGAFDSFKHEHLPRTKYDIIIDETSNKPGEQAFEKCISGRYLGEILRLVICDLIDEGVIFLGQNTYKIEVPYALDTAFLSLMESDSTDELLTIIGIFTHFFGLETTLAERQFFRTLARLVSRRAARLSACGIAALVKRGGYLDMEGECIVAADGSLYKKYPKFADRIHEGLTDIFGERGKNIVTYNAEDGSGVGSAIIAAMTQKRKAEGLYAFA